MIQQKTILYKDDQLTYEGVLCWDDSTSESRPGVLVAHAFGGQSSFDIEKAYLLAELGYVGFAIDMYGQGNRATTREEASRLMHTLTDNRPLLLERMTLAWEVLKSLEKVDANRTAAIGFCFGGKCVLDLARSGVNINGVVPFHGIFDQPGIQYTAPILASILVLHGYDDPLATPNQMVELTDELSKRKADWQLVAFGNTGHAFTNPKANAPEIGMIFNSTTNERAWKMMENFLASIFSNH